MESKFQISLARFLLPLFALSLLLLTSCGGGIGPNDFDTLAAIEQWVEQGQAPSSIVASHSGGIGTDRKRPLCPFP